MDLGVPLWKQLQNRINERKHEGLFREPIEFDVSSGRLLITRQGEELIHFGSNDYLGLSWRTDPSLKAAEDPSDGADMLAKSASRDPRTGSNRESHESDNRYGAGASPLLAGHSRAHEELCRAVAAFEGTESSVLFSSGYAANIGVISALAAQGDVIFSDSLNHASLIDGCRLSKAAVHVYRHNDMAHLEDLIHSYRSQARHAFIVSDSLFSMDGDVGDLRSIERLAEMFDLVCIVDEAHATGVFGTHGEGLLSELGCCSERWIKVGTFSKAIGCSGGFVAANRVVTQWLHNYARSYIYSTSMPLPHCESALASLALLKSMDSQRLELRKQSSWLRTQLRALGHRVGGGEGLGDETPIIALYAPSVTTVSDWSKQLRERGLYVPAIRPPTVPADCSLLRISLSTSHLRSDLERLVESCRF